jgi:hypothetical protein
VRTFDASKLRTVSGSLDDHALPNSSKLVFPLNGGVVGLGLPMAQMLASPSSRQSMPPHPRFDMDGLEKSQRKTSFKKVLKQSGEKLSSVVSGQRYSVEAQRPPFLAQIGRMGSKRSRSSGEEVRLTPLTSTTEASPSSTRSRPSDKTSWHAPHVDEDIEKRVHEMAGLGLGVAPLPSSTDPQRVHNEGVAKLSPGAIMTRSRSAEDDKSVPGEAEIPDMRMLRRIADLPSNNRCADCGKGMKSSRWATLSELGHDISSCFAETSRTALIVYTRSA